MPLEMIEGEGHKIAIVDDDLSIPDSLRFLLEVMGRTVETFASAAEFLQIDVRQFACLILDQHMPNMTGLELAGRLRAEGTGILTHPLISLRQGVACSATALMAGRRHWRMAGRTGRELG